MKNATISAVVAVKNEEKNIKRCLESVRWVDEIILVDSNSSDSTFEIAKEYWPKVRVYQYKKKDYLIEEKKNFGIKKATKEWILIIDADEEVTPVLKKEIIKKINTTNFDAFNVYFQNYAFNRFLKGSYWKDMPIIRLFKRGKGIYKSIQPHSLLAVNGKIGYLEGYINHYTFRNTMEFLAKTDKYTSLSTPFIIKHNKGGILNRQKIRINFYSCYIEPLLFSSWVFFMKKMYKDYFIGLWISLLMGYYLYLERKKVKRLKNKKWKQEYC